MEIEFINTDNPTSQPVIQDVDLDSQEEVVLEEPTPKAPETTKEKTTTSKSKTNTTSNEFTVVDTLEELEASADVEEQTEEEIPSKESKEPKESKSGKTLKVDKDSSSSSPYSVLAKALYEKGVYANFDENEFAELVEEMGPAEALIELNKRTISDGVEAYKNSLTPEAKAYLDALEANVPHSTFISLQSQTMQYAKLTSEQVKKDEKLAASLYKTALKIKGFEDNEIEDYIADADAVGKTIDKGIASLAYLQKHTQKQEQEAIEAGKRQQEARLENNRRELEALKTKINAMEEVLPGQKLSPKLRKQMYEAITVPVHKDEESGMLFSLVGKKRLEDPNGFDAKLAYLIISGVFDNKVEKLVRSAKSSAVRELDDMLEGSTNKRGVPGPKRESSTSNELLESAKRTFVKQI